MREPALTEPPLQSVVVAATVVPYLRGRQECGVVPQPDLPSYAAYRWWSESRLAPIEGVPMSERTEDWTYDGPTEHVRGPYWYFGVMDRHFGHFVTGSLSRTWWHLDHPAHGRRAVVVSLGASPGEDGGVVVPPILDWQREIFDYLGIESPLIINRATRFDDLLIPEPAAYLLGPTQRKPLREGLARLDLQASGPRHPGRKVFLRRPETSALGRVIGEEALSPMLRAAGYIELRPESLSVRDQLRAVRNATHVVSVEGSALHLFNLLGLSPDTAVVSLQRLSGYSSGVFEAVLGPHVGSLSTVGVAARFAVGAGSAKHLVVPDLQAIRAKLADFDETIDWSRFDYALFFDAFARSLGEISEDRTFDVAEFLG